MAALKILEVFCLQLILIFLPVFVLRHVSLTIMLLFFLDMFQFAYTIQRGVENGTSLNKAELESYFKEEDFNGHITMCLASSF